MECKHQYFNYRNGVLVCSNCGRPAGELKKPAIEDKIGETSESKRIAPRGTGKVSGNKRR